MDKVCDAIVAHNLDKLKNIELSDELKREVCAHLIGGIQFRYRPAYYISIFHILQIDINYSDSTIGLPINVMISSGRYDIAKMMIKRLNANIFIRNVYTGNTPFACMFKYACEISPSTEYYDLLDYMLLQYHRCNLLNEDLLHELAISQYNMEGKAYNHCRQKMKGYRALDVAAYVISIPHDIVNEIMKYI